MVELAKCISKFEIRDLQKRFPVEAISGIGNNPADVLKQVFGCKPFKYEPCGIAVVETFADAQSVLGKAQVQLQNKLSESVGNKCDRMPKIMTCPER